MKPAHVTRQEQQTAEAAKRIARRVGMILPRVHIREGMDVDSMIDNGRLYLSRAALTDRPRCLASIIRAMSPDVETIARMIMGT